MMALAAGAAAAVCVWLLLSPPARTAFRFDHPPRAARRPPRWLWACLAAAVGLVAAAIVGGAGAVPVLVGAAVLLATGGVLVVRGRRRSAARAMAEQVARACQVFAGQLRIGALPVAALREAVEDCPALGAAVSAHEVGAAVAESLRTLASRPGAAGLATLAAAWQLSERSGAPLAMAAERVAVQLGERAALRRSVESELAPARATGKLLAGLPLVGLAMGVMVGSSPEQFLAGTTLGRWLVAGAVTLACVGILWTEALAERVERRTA
ncbi:type II secretion system F family protein [Propionibacteriaceae bacterium G1746]|uniref:type II secretion system F family protein n=1 Tax=Aestuariimicrobium sp. G57 TaxID=3418485 RepID=UPI003C14D150